MLNDGYDLSIAEQEYIFMGLETLDIKTTRTRKKIDASEQRAIIIEPIRVLHEQMQQQIQERIDELLLLEGRATRRADEFIKHQKEMQETNLEKLLESQEDMVRELDGMIAMNTTVVHNLDLKVSKMTDLKQDIDNIIAGFEKRMREMMWKIGLWSVYIGIMIASINMIIKFFM